MNLMHPHFVVVHLARFIFGMHLAISSAFAVYHHARRTSLLVRLLPRVGPRKR